MPELLLENTSPYGTRRASVLRGDNDVYLYLEDLAGPRVETCSAVWVTNVGPAPDSPPPAPQGAPPAMPASGTRHPEGCPPRGPMELVWFEEGDAVALVDGDGVLAFIPGWGGREGFYGYARHARGQQPLAWELDPEVRSAVEPRVAESRDFWRWRTGDAWEDVRTSGVDHLEQRIGPLDAVWPLTPEGAFPQLVATRHKLPDRDVWVTATTGLSAQRMAAVEQHVDDPDAVGRIELAIARTVPDELGAHLLGGLAAVPLKRCTWLGDGHTIGGVGGSLLAFGPAKTALMLTVNPPSAHGHPAPDLQGLVRRGAPVTYLWVLVVDQITFQLARERTPAVALTHIASQGGSWVG